MTRVNAMRCLRVSHHLCLMVLERSCALHVHPSETLLGRYTIMQSTIFFHTAVAKTYSVSLRSAAFRSILLLTLFSFFSGCHNHARALSETSTPPQAIMPVRQESEIIVLREGDVVKVSFPGAANLDTIQPIRRDGLIVLPIIGEIRAAGLTSAELNAQISKLYAPQLVNKEVNVTVVSSSFSVFVSGAVLRPGKIVSDKPLTALEAIMEAGGFDSTKANMRAVTIIRQGRALPEKLDIKSVLEGKEVEPFFLKPSDIVHVPDRLVLF